jgi:hypothetical protein
MLKFSGYSRLNRGLRSENNFADQRNESTYSLSNRSSIPGEHHAPLSSGDTSLLSPPFLQPKQGSPNRNCDQIEQLVIAFKPSGSY